MYKTMKNDDYIEAPNYYNHPIGRKMIFLGGTITNASFDWQKVCYDYLLAHDFIVFNPKRKFFDVKDKSQSEIQIRWEYHHLQLADHIIFYFDKGSDAPITLYELGKELGNKNNPKNIYICIDPEYSRLSDVVIQSNLTKNQCIKYLATDGNLNNLLKKIAEQ